MFKNIRSFWNSLWYCLKLAWKSSKSYTLVRLAGNFLIPVISILTTYIVKMILDLLVPSTLTVPQALTQVAVLLGLGFLLAGLSSLIQRFTTHAVTIQNNIIQNSVSLSMLEKAMSSDISLYDNAKFYDKFSSARSDSFSMASILWNVLDCISAIFTLAGSFIILSQENVLYALTITLLIIPTTIANQYYVRKIYQNDLNQMNNQRQKDYLFFLGSTKEYSQEIRCWNLANYIKKKYLALWELIFKTKKKLSIHQTIVVFILSVFPEIAICLISIQIAEKVLNQVLTIGDYSFYTALMAQILSSTMIFISHIISVYANKLKIENMRGFDLYASHKIVCGNEHISNIELIEFKNVTFSYPDTHKEILKNLSFSIAAPTKVVLVGKNGAGKSTLIKLLLRLYDVNIGEICINGRDIKEYQLEELHQCFGIYFQNSPNFSFTILENILLNQEFSSKTKQQIHELFIRCNADDVIERCSNDLDTYLGRAFSDYGIELSEGQHQKLAIIRALYQQSSCLILDEPSSSLDPETEHKIFQCLEEISNGKIAIFTSHRLSNIHLADQIFVLENGEIIEQGTRQELLQKQDGRFSELYEYQAQKFRE